MNNQQGEWIHIADHAWEFYQTGVQYTVHEDTTGWIARRFTLTNSGDATQQSEETVRTLDDAKTLVDKWESQRHDQQPSLGDPH